MSNDPNKCTCNTVNQHTVSDHCPYKEYLTKDQFDKLKAARAKPKQIEFRGD